MQLARTFPASLPDSGAMRARSLRAAPTRRAFDNRGKPGSLTLKCYLKFWARFNLVEQSIRNGRIGVNAAVAQERPVAANLLQRSHVDLADQNLLAIMRSFGQHSPER